MPMPPLPAYRELVHGSLPPADILMPTSMTINLLDGSEVGAPGAPGETSTADQ